MKHLYFLIVLPLFLGLTWFNAAQATDCNCERYRVWTRQLELSQQMALIGTASLRRQDAPFAIDADERQAMRLQLEVEGFVPAECRATALAQTSALFQLWLSEAYLQPKPNILFTDQGNGMAAINWYKVNVSRACASGAPSNLAQICNEPGNLNRLVNLFKLSQAEIESVGPRDASGAPGYPLTPELKEVISIFLTSYKLQLDGGARDAYLKTQAGHLSTEQIIAFGRMDGYLEYSNYENERNTQAYHAKGVRTPEALAANSAKALNQDVSYSDLTGDPNALKSDDPRPAQDASALPVPLGVCRDIASQQAIDMRALGMKHAYVVSWTYSGDEGHVTVLAAANDNPGRIFKINQGSLVTSDHADGAVALFQSRDDASLNYRIWEPGGALLSDVPSEFGKVIEVAAGGNTRELDPLSAGPARFTGVEAALLSNTQLRFFVAEDRIGAQYVGAAVGQHWNVNSPIAPGEAALVVGHQNLSGLAKDDRHTEFAAIRVAQAFNTPYLELKAQPVRARLASKEMAVAAETFNPAYPKYPMKGFSYPQGDLRALGGVEVQVGNPGQVHANLYSGVQLVPGVKDVRNNYIGQVPRAVINQFINSLEVKAPIDEDQRAYLLARALAVCSQLSCRGKAEVAAAYRNIAASLELQGRFKKDTPLFEEGTGRALSWNVAAQLLSKFPAYLTVTGQHSLEAHDTRIQGGVEIKN